MTRSNTRCSHGAMSPYPWGKRLDIARRLQDSERFRRFHDVGSIDPELFQHLVARGAHAEALQAENLSIQTDILIPEMGHTSFNRHATPTFCRQHLFAIISGLPLEPFEARHRDDTRPSAEFA